MKKYLFVDLDDTLFSTLEKCGSDDALRATAFLKDGTACSYTTARQRAFLQVVEGGMTVVPTTARNRDALSRVDIAFTDHKIINYGGLILTPDGQPEPYWMARMQSQMSAALPGLQQVMQRIDDYGALHGYPARARLIEDFNVAFYVVVKDPDKVVANLARLVEQVVAPWVAGEGGDFYIHLNGNNLAILPKTLNKAHAVAYLLECLRQQHGDIMTIGMGDSRSDAAFMALCDYAVVPRHSQLARLTVAAL